MIPLDRSRLTILLNALYDSGTDRITVSHPSDAVGDLCRLELGAPADTNVRILLDERAYADARDDVKRDHGGAVAGELPEPQSYVNAFVAGGLLDPANKDELGEFLERNGHPDLSAGHRPVVAGFDTNLLPWRIADVLDLQAGEDAVVSGFAVATGVRDELDWDHKVSDTDSLVDAFGDEFEELWNQPAGSRREGRLGELQYRQLRDHRYADQVDTGRGDEDIVAGYDAYQSDNRKDVLLFSHDRNFIERARAHRVRAQRVEFPTTLPRSITGTWHQVENTLYVLALLFGVLVLPKVTVYGVWRGKSGQEWHDETLQLDCRSEKIEPLIARDSAIVDAFDQ